MSVIWWELSCHAHYPVLVCLLYCCGRCQTLSLRRPVVPIHQRARGQWAPIVPQGNGVGHSGTAGPSEWCDRLSAIVSVVRLWEKDAGFLAMVGKRRRRVALCMKKQPKCRRWTTGCLRPHEWSQRGWSGWHCAASLLKTIKQRVELEKGSYK